MRFLPSELVQPCVPGLSCRNAPPIIYSRYRGVPRGVWPFMIAYENAGYHRYFSLTLRDRVRRIRT